MNGESNNESQNDQENVPTTANELKNVQVAEDTSEISAYNFQPNQQFTEVVRPLNENKSLVHSDYYTTVHADLQRQQSNFTTEHNSVKSDVRFERISSENQAPRIEVSTIPIYSKDCHTRQQTQEGMSAQQQFSRHSVNEYCTTVASIVDSTSVTSNRLDYCAGSENSNLTFGSYGAIKFCSSDELEYNPNVRQANVQRESINFVLAHQWHQRREKLPTKLDPAFYTEWQINRRGVIINTAEIQKRKLQFFQRKVEEQLDRVNRENSSSTEYQTEKQTQKQTQPCDPQQQQQQQLHQAHHLYRLHQMQLQNHPPSLTPDSPSSSSRQFARLPLSLNSSGSTHQLSPQALSRIYPALFQRTLSNNDNSMYNLATLSQQQQLIMQMLQQQHFQQDLIQRYQSTIGPDFFEQWQQLNQQRYYEASRENAIRHKSACSSRALSRKRKRRHFSLKVVGGKENASGNSSEPKIATDESVVESSNVLDNPKSADDDLKSNFNFAKQVEGNVIVNLSDVKILSSNDENNVNNDIQSKSKGSCQSTLHHQTGLWQNNYAMLQDWLKTQQQNIDQNARSEVAQYAE